MGELVKKKNSMLRLGCKRLQFVVFFLVAVILAPFSNAQDSINFKLPEGQSKVEIPFENHNNLIIINVQVGGSITSKFILDSGARGTVLIEKVIGDILGLNYTTEYSVAGAGTEGSVKAYLAEDVPMEIEGLQANPMDIFVLEQDYLQLPKYLGIRVQGILGIGFFKDLIVKIDYEERKLIAYDPQHFDPPRRYEHIPLSGNDEKPYILGELNIRDKKHDTARFLIDTGASHAILIEMNEQNKLSVPEEHIETSLGRGLSGEIPGYIGRVKTFKVGSYQLEEVITSFTSRYSKIQKKGRVGTIGGELLSRFSVIIDMTNKKIYLKPSDKFNKKFDFNMSGMHLKAFGEDLDRIKIDYIREGSPADKAGLKPGDEILKLNWIWIELYSLSHLYSILRSRDGRTIRLKILRNGEEKKKFKFQLKRLI